jgi:transcriptional regulator with XRE-family HTH domain
VVNQDMDALKKKFGARLRLLRTQRQMTQEQLAAAASMSVDFLSLIERGRNAPSFTYLEKLAKALKVPVKDLFKFDER